MYSPAVVLYIVSSKFLLNTESSNIVFLDFNQSNPKLNDWERKRDAIDSVCFAETHFKAVKKGFVFGDRYYNSLIGNTANS